MKRYLRVVFPTLLIIVTMGSALAQNSPAAQDSMGVHLTSPDSIIGLDYENEVELADLFGPSESRRREWCNFVIDETVRVRHLIDQVTSPDRNRILRDIYEKMANVLWLVTEKCRNPYVSLMIFDLYIERVWYVEDKFTRHLLYEVLLDCEEDLMRKPYLDELTKYIARSIRDNLFELVEKDSIRVASADHDSTSEQHVMHHETHARHPSQKPKENSRLEERIKYIKQQSVRSDDTDRRGRRITRPDPQVNRREYLKSHRPEGWRGRSGQGRRRR